MGNPEISDMQIYDRALDDNKLMESLLYEDNAGGDAIEKNAGFEI